MSEIPVYLYVLNITNLVTEKGSTIISGSSVTQFNNTLGILKSLEYNVEYSAQHDYYIISNK